MQEAAEFDELEKKRRPEKSDKDKKGKEKEDGAEENEKPDGADDKVRYIYIYNVHL